MIRDQIVKRQRNQRNNIHEDQLRNNEERDHIFDNSIYNEENNNASIDQRDIINFFELVDESSHEFNHTTIESQNASNV